MYNCPIYTVDNRAAVLRVFITNLQLLQDACNEAEQVSVSCDHLIASGCCSHDHYTVSFIMYRIAGIL